MKTNAHKIAILQPKVIQMIPDAVDGQNTATLEKKSFIRKLVESFIAADIPFHKLLNPKFRLFIQSLAKHKIPHPSTLRGLLSDIAGEKINDVRERIKGKDVYLMVDESPDVKSRNVVTVLVGVLDGKESKSMLIDVSYPGRVNNTTIREIIMKACLILWPNTNQYPHLHLVISDQAQYMVLAIKKLKQNRLMFPNINHITCVNHAINLVCEAIVKQFNLVNTFIANQKKFFQNSGKRKRMFKEKMKINVPPFPVSTRWGSWLKCVNYALVNDNFERICRFFIEYQEENVVEPKSLSVIRAIVKQSQLRTDIIELSQYSEIPNIITKLEKQSMSVDSQLNYVNQVKDIIKGTQFENILSQSLAKNPHFISFFDTASNSILDLKNRKYCPLTSCDVERSFSVYRSILSDKRTNLTTSHLTSMMIIKYNQNM